MIITLDVDGSLKHIGEYMKAIKIDNALIKRISFDVTKGDD